MRRKYILESEITNFQIIPQYLFSSLATVFLFLNKKHILHKYNSVTLSCIQNSFLKIVFDFKYAELVYFTSPVE